MARFLPEPLRERLAFLYSQNFIPYPKISSLPSAMNLHFQDALLWYKRAANYLQSNRMQGVYAEFGVYGANTFRLALNTIGNYKRFYGHPPAKHFYAFDSFTGLPEPMGIDKQKGWTQGKFTMSKGKFERIIKKDLHRVTTVNGFYHSSLPSHHWNPEHKIVLAYIDCDFYESIIPVMDFLKTKLAHGAIVAFDDWNCYYGDPQRGAKRAFAEFQAGWKDGYFEPFLNISYCGTSFIYLQKDMMGKEIL